MEKNEIIEKIVATSWYHSFEILPGIVTPGSLDVFPRQILEDFSVPADLSGKKILEIGTWDGPLAFALEARGADVVASDIQDPDATAFNTAKQILQSRIQYVRAGVYDLRQKIDTTFDSVFMLGVLYHLKHPLLALEEIAKLLKPDGTAYLEGECFLNYAENLNLETPDSPPVKADPHFIQTAASADVPLTLCYPGQYKQRENWFIPNIACLKSWFHAAGFDIVDLTIRKNSHPFQRFICCLQKKRESIREHIVLSRDSLSPHPQTIIRKALLLKSIGRYSEAVELLLPLTGTDHDDKNKMSALVQLAAIYREQNHPDQETLYQQALDQLFKMPDRNDSEIYNKASAYKVLEEFSRAEALFESILQNQVNPQLKTVNNDFVAGIYFHLGEIRYCTRRYREARTAFEKCLSFLPRHEKARHYLEKISTT